MEKTFKLYDNGKFNWLKTYYNTEKYTLSILVLQSWQFNFIFYLIIIWYKLLNATNLAKWQSWNWDYRNAPIERSLIMYVVIFKTDVIVFIGYVRLYLMLHWPMIFNISQLFYRLRETVFNVTLTYDFQYQSVVFIGYVRLYLTLHWPMIFSISQLFL
jgi:hypothetical protein